MSDKSVMCVVTIDLKQYRIRVHKSALHQIGDPEYIQLMIKPSEGVMAIRAAEKDSAADQTYTIHWRDLNAHDSVVLHGRSFIERLLHATDQLQRGAVYRIYGAAVPESKVIIFFLGTIQQIMEPGGALHAGQSRAPVAY